MLNNLIAANKARRARGMFCWYRSEYVTLMLLKIRSLLPE